MMFKDKTVLITGASRGIGKATALAFAKEGANVAVNYCSSETEAIGVVKEIESIGSKAIAIQCDVSKEDEVISMIEQTISSFGSIDVLVNNAGSVEDVPILERTYADWRRTLDVNLIGQFLCIKQAAKKMLAQGGGRVINISSTSAIYSFSPDIVDYDAAKAGVASLTKNFAKTLAPSILVNAVAPGWVDTDIHKELPLDFLDKEKEDIFLKRFAKPEEIARVILFLAGEGSGFITGSVLVVDGGHN